MKGAVMRKSIVLLVICFASACGVYTKFLGSKPTLGEHEVWTHRIILDGLDLNIRPYNDIRDFEMVNSVVLIPVYVSGEDKPLYEGQSEFNFLFGYLPHEDGFSLDPHKITLLLGDERFSVSVLHEWLNPVSKHGDSWYGYCGRPIPDSYHRMSYDTLDEDEWKNWHCFQLRFATPPPHPSTKFALVIDGFERNEEKYEVPVIWFEEYVWHRSDSVP